MNPPPRCTYLQLNLFPAQPIISIPFSAGKGSCTACTHSINGKISIAYGTEGRIVAG